MKRVGLIGHRGMLGQVLLERMKQEGDLALFGPLFFSASPAGKSVSVGQGSYPLLDAFDLAALAKLDIILSCKGGDYTRRVHPQLRRAGWKGLWLDAASVLRMEKSTCLVLDPINLERIEAAKRAGVRDYAGANCTVSLMLLALAGPFRLGLIEWVNSATYQAASGAGARHMGELLRQMRHLVEGEQLDGRLPGDVLALSEKVADKMLGEDLPREHFGVALACGLIPWIDRPMGEGRTREEWKGQAESNKILGLAGGEKLAVDGTCVRIGSLRCHAQALTVKLKRDVPMDELEQIIAQAHPWMRLVPNTRQETVQAFCPARLGGTLEIALGRLRRSSLGPTHLQAFTMGDQLLWGGAEPLRRALRLLLEV